MITNGIAMAIVCLTASGVQPGTSPGIIKIKMSTVTQDGGRFGLAGF
jgi:hypothetical protein